MRWSLLGTTPDAVLLGVSGLVILFLVVAGLAIFRSCERDLVDRL